MGSAFPIVGVGASAGGLDAFHKFLDHMPADSGMAFVMILHLPADRKSMLGDILSRWTAMRVVEGVQGVLLEPNCVYVPPPHAIVTVQDGRLGIEMGVPDVSEIPRPIDAFFDSLAVALGGRAVGIVLSGTGSDGALGLKAIKESGGLTIVQGSEGSVPEFGEMPAAAIATGAVDLVAPIEAIPGHLLRIKGEAAPGVDPVDAPAREVDVARLEICSILKTRLGHDFSGYRDKTFLRRVQRRMQVIGTRNLADYIDRLRTDREEVVLLFRDLLIRVTSFFRDRSAFAALEAQVIPRLFSGKQADGAVRVWVPGCATGEEAYSLAMLLREHMDAMSCAPRVQVFATDIDETAIATARLGRYPRTLLKGLSSERFDRFCSASQGGFVVSKEIRDLCTFSLHNVVRDPPFSRMDLVSCRNLLIYMEADLQAAVIPAFHYALLHGGILLLGGSESTARHEELFEPLDKVARIFRRRPGRSPALNLKARTGNLGLQRSLLEASRLPPLADLRPLPPAAGPPRRSPSPGDYDREFGNERLQQALLATQEQLQSLAEQHQTALEELRSVNEELNSVNEEMQSTNEELETSKEELQSMNEELQTVNVQLAEKVGELAASNSDLRNLFESTEIATIFLDRNLNIRSFTTAIAALYNLIPGDVGRPLSDMGNCLDYESIDTDVASVLARLKPLERRIARRDRSTHYIMRILPYREPDGSVNGVLITFVDVTNIVHAEAELREAALRKDIFLATLSHELRNPLAPIRSAAKLLGAANVLPTQSARAQTIITRQVAHMSSLLDDLLDVSRVTRGTFSLRKERVVVNKLLEAAVESVQPAMEAKQHTLHLELAEGHVTVLVDPVRMTQVLTNLLTNAAKYTPAGGLITVGSRLDAQELILFVRDNGIGINPAEIPQVFDMFTRIESADGASEGGLGIGLALVRGLIQLHGGYVTATSAGLGQGSEFVVNLPGALVLDAPASVEGRGVTAETGPGQRVLIADDNQDGAETLGMLLNLFGHEVFLAYSGTEALRVAKEKRPDVAVLDIGMPDLSGYEVAQQIRHESWGEQMTLIALTGWGQENDRRRAQAAGFDHHCTKPVNPDDLQRFITPRSQAAVPRVV